LEIRNSEFGIRNFPALLQRLNLDLAILTLLVLLVNAPYLSGRFLPIHDTIQTFQGFHYFYSRFCLEGELPRWYSTGTFGTPSGFWQLVYLTPASYLCLLAGRLLQVRNVLLLFKVSLLLEQVMLLVGTYKLSRLLFRHRASVFLVCAGMVGSVVWYSQIWWSLRIYYLIPLVLFFLLSFFEGRGPHHLWLAGITSVLGLVGNLMYYGVLWLFVLFVVVAVLTSCRPRAWGSLFRPSAAHLVSLLLFVGLAAAYVGLVRHSFAGMEIGVSGREPESGKTPLITFLIYGGLVKVPLLFHMLLFGWPVHTPWSGHMDNTVYMGLLSLLLVGYAAVKVRDIRFLALGAGAFFLVWLSAAGAFARLMYLVPGFSLFRHLGLVYTLVRVLLLVCAGFGLEAFLRHGTRRHALYAGVALVVLMDFVVDRKVPCGFKYQVGLPNLVWWENGGWLLPFGIRMGLYAVLAGFLAGPGMVRGILRWLGRGGLAVERLREPRRPVAVWATLACFVADLLLFQTMAAVVRPRLPEGRESYLYTTRAYAAPLSDRRLKFPRDDRAMDAMRLMRSLQHYTATNETLYAFAGYDRWPFDHPVVLEPAGVRRLVLARRGVLGAERKSTETLTQMGYGGLDPALKRVLGCEASKFRLLTNPVFADSVEDAARTIKKVRELDQTLVLRGVPPGRCRTGGGERSSGEAGTVRLLEATANQVTLETHVAGEEPAWLVYSDSWHPDWRATVNGKEVSIAEAYLAFKAVPVGGGRSVVRFRFSGGRATWLADLLAASAFVFAVVMLVEYGRLLFSAGAEPSPRNDSGAGG